MTTASDKNYRIYFGGEQDVRLGVGDEVYDPRNGDLLQLTGALGRIHTDDPHGNYRIAKCGPADRDVTNLTDREFAALAEASVDEYAEDGDAGE